MIIENFYLKIGDKKLFFEVEGDSECYAENRSRIMEALETIGKIEK